MDNINILDTYQERIIGNVIFNLDIGLNKWRTVNPFGPVFFSGNIKVMSDDILLLLYRAILCISLISLSFFPLACSQMKDSGKNLMINQT